jgi:anti-sigma B factor antagonist
MDLVVTQDGAPVLRIALSGRLDAAGAEKIETEFANRVSKAGRGVIVDMSGVSFVGSLGIRLLISNSRSAQRAGHRVVLMGVQPAVAEVFATVALDELIPSVADEAAALALLAR